MPLLQNSKVLRAGVTAAYWNHGTNNIRVTSDNAGVSIGFTIASKGGGRTQIKTTISPSDFEEVVSQMLKSNESEALKVMSAAIANHHA